MTHSLINFLDGCPLSDEDEPPGSDDKNSIMISFFSEKSDISNDFEIEQPKYYIHYDPAKRNLIYRFPKLFDAEVN
jgi:hypothetical protein